MGYWVWPKFEFLWIVGVGEEENGSDMRSSLEFWSKFIFIPRILSVISFIISFRYYPRNDSDVDDAENVESGTLVAGANRTGVLTLCCSQCSRVFLYSTGASACASWSGSRFDFTAWLLTRWSRSENCPWSLRSRYLWSELLWSVMSWPETVLLLLSMCENAERELAECESTVRLKYSRYNRIWYYWDMKSRLR